MKAVVTIVEKTGVVQATEYDDLETAEQAWQQEASRSTQCAGIGLEAISPDGSTQTINAVMSNVEADSELFLERILELRQARDKKQD